jgi:hypothetical protein
MVLVFYIFGLVKKENDSAIDSLRGEHFAGELRM